LPVATREATGAKRRQSCRAHSKAGAFGLGLPAQVLALAVTHAHAAAITDLRLLLAQALSESVPILS